MINLLIDNTHSPFTQEQIIQLKKWGYNLKNIEDLNEEFDWPEVIAGSSKLKLFDLEKYSHLKLVQLYSAGYNNVDIIKAKQQSITVCNARGAYSVQIAEYVLAKVLSVYKNNRLYDAFQAQKEWNTDEHMVSLVGQKVAILGTGSIGQEVAKRFKAFATQNIGFNSTGHFEEHFDECYPLKQLHERIAEFDVVIICLPLNDDTKGLFNLELIRKMKDTAILVNIGRGKIIIEDDLIKALDTNLRAVILDVFEKEPLSAESPLWHHPKVYLTAHISYRDNSTQESLHSIVLENLKRYAHHEELINRIV